MNLKELLEQNKALLKKQEKEYYQPVRRTFLAEFLISPEKTVGPVIVNIYVPNPPEGYPVGVPIPDTHCVVVHGHDEGVGCSAPYYCHELSYSPTGGEAPEFIRLFNKKWKQNGN